MSAEAMASAMASDIDALAPRPHTELATCKSDYVNIIQIRIEKLDLRRNILQLKYDDFKYCNDSLQIFIIISSTLLTLLEACKSELQNEISSGTLALQHFLSLLPVFMAASIATVASVIKFKKYQERMERMIRAIDVCVEASFMMKKTQESVRKCPDRESLTALKSDTDIYEPYCKAQEGVERCLKYSDLAEHLAEFHAMTLTLRRTEAEFQSQALNPVRATIPWWSRLLCCRRMKRQDTSSQCTF